MSTTLNVQGLLTNVFRPRSVYDTNNKYFYTKLELSNVDTVFANTITISNASIGDANNNVYVGTNAGNPYNFLQSSFNNVALGVSAGGSLSNVSNSVFIGYLAGNGVTSISSSILVGANTFGNGGSNIFIGTGTGLSNGSNNIFLGQNISRAGPINNRLYVGTGSNITLAADLSNNFVGIATTAPQYALDVSGYASVHNGLAVGGANPLAHTLNVNGDTYFDDGLGFMQFTHDVCSNTVVTVSSHSNTASLLVGGVIQATEGFYSLKGVTASMASGESVVIGKLLGGMFTVSVQNIAAANNFDGRMDFCLDYTTPVICNMSRTNTSGSNFIVYTGSNIVLSNAATSNVSFTWSILFIDPLGFSGATTMVPVAMASVSPPSTYRSYNSTSGYPSTNRRYLSNLTPATLSSSNTSTANSILNAAALATARSNASLYSSYATLDANAIPAFVTSATTQAGIANTSYTSAASFVTTLSNLLSANPNVSSLSGYIASASNNLALALTARNDGSSALTSAIAFRETALAAASNAAAALVSANASTSLTAVQAATTAAGGYRTVTSNSSNSASTNASLALAKASAVTSYRTTISNAVTSANADIATYNTQVAAITLSNQLAAFRSDASGLMTQLTNFATSVESVYASSSNISNVASGRRTTGGNTYYSITSLAESSTSYSLASYVTTASQYDASLSSLLDLLIADHTTIAQANTSTQNSSSNGLAYYNQVQIAATFSAASTAIAQLSNTLSNASTQSANVAGKYTAINANNQLIDDKTVALGVVLTQASNALAGYNTEQAAAAAAAAAAALAAAGSLLTAQTDTSQFAATALTKANSATSNFSLFSNYVTSANNYYIQVVENVAAVSNISNANPSLSSQLSAILQTATVIATDASSYSKDITSAQTRSLTYKNDTVTASSNAATESANAYATTDISLSLSYRLAASNYANTAISNDTAVSNDTTVALAKLTLVSNSVTSSAGQISAATSNVSNAVQGVRDSIGALYTQALSDADVIHAKYQQVFDYGSPVSLTYSTVLTNRPVLTNSGNVQAFTNYSNSLNGYWATASSNYQVLSTQMFNASNSNSYYTTTSLSFINQMLEAANATSSLSSALASQNTAISNGLGPIITYMNGALVSVTATADLVTAGLVPISTATSNAISSYSNWQSTQTNYQSASNSSVLAQSNFVITQSNVANAAPSLSNALSYFNAAIAIASNYTGTNIQSYLTATSDAYLAVSNAYLAASNASIDASAAGTLALSAASDTQIHSTYAGMASSLAEVITYTALSVSSASNASFQLARTVTDVSTVLSNTALIVGYTANTAVAFSNTAQAVLDYAVLNSLSSLATSAQSAIAAANVAINGVAATQTLADIAAAKVSTSNSFVTASNSYDSVISYYNTTLVQYGNANSSYGYTVTDLSAGKVLATGSAATNVTSLVTTLSNNVSDASSAKFTAYTALLDVSGRLITASNAEGAALTAKASASNAATSAQASSATAAGTLAATQGTSNATSAAASAAIATTQAGAAGSANISSISTLSSLTALLASAVSGANAFYVNTSNASNTSSSYMTSANQEYSNVLSAYSNAASYASNAATMYTALITLAGASTDSFIVSYKTDASTHLTAVNSNLALVATARDNTSNQLVTLNSKNVVISNATVSASNNNVIASSATAILVAQNACNSISNSYVTASNALVDASTTLTSLSVFASSVNTYSTAVSNAADNLAIANARVSATISVNTMQPYIDTTNSNYVIVSNQWNVVNGYNTIINEFYVANDCNTTYNDAVDAALTYLIAFNSFRQDASNRTLSSAGYASSNSDLIAIVRNASVTRTAAEAAAGSLLGHRNMISNSATYTTTIASNAVTQSIAASNSGILVWDAIAVYTQSKIDLSQVLIDVSASYTTAIGYSNLYGAGSLDAFVVASSNAWYRPSNYTYPAYSLEVLQASADTTPDKDAIVIKKNVALTKWSNVTFEYGMFALTMGNISSAYAQALSMNTLGQQSYNVLAISAAISNAQVQASVATPEVLSGLLGRVYDISSNANLAIAAEIDASGYYTSALNKLRDGFILNTKNYISAAQTEIKLSQSTILTNISINPSAAEIQDTWSNTLTSNLTDVNSYKTDLSTKLVQVSVWKAQYPSATGIFTAAGPISNVHYPAISSNIVTINAQSNSLVTYQSAVVSSLNIATNAATTVGGYVTDISQIIISFPSILTVADASGYSNAVSAKITDTTTLMSNVTAVYMNNPISNDISGYLTAASNARNSASNSYVTASNLYYTLASNIQMISNVATTLSPILTDATNKVNAIQSDVCGYQQYATMAYAMSNNPTDLDVILLKQWLVTLSNIAPLASSATSLFSATVDAVTSHWDPYALRYTNGIPLVTQAYSNLALVQQQYDFAVSTSLSQGGWDQTSIEYVATDMRSIISNTIYGRSSLVDLVLSANQLQANLPFGQAASFPGKVNDSYAYFNLQFFTNGSLKLAIVDPTVPVLNNIGGYVFGGIYSLTLDPGWTGGIILSNDENLKSTLSSNTPRIFNLVSNAYTTVNAYSGMTFTGSDGEITGGSTVTAESQSTGHATELSNLSSSLSIATPKNSSIVSGLVTINAYYNGMLSTYTSNVLAPSQIYDSFTYSETDTSVRRNQFAVARTDWINIISNQNPYVLDGQVKETIPTAATLLSLDASLQGIETLVSNSLAAFNGLGLTNTYSRASVYLYNYTPTGGTPGSDIVLRNSLTTSAFADVPYTLDGNTVHPPFAFGGQGMGSNAGGSGWTVSFVYEGTTYENRVVAGVWTPPIDSGTNLPTTSSGLGGTFSSDLTGFTVAANSSYSATYFGSSPDGLVAGGK